MLEDAGSIPASSTASSIEVLLRPAAPTSSGRLSGVLAGGPHSTSGLVHLRDEATMCDGQVRGRQVLVEPPD
jgi:hypothetical protein